jgi:hypothetical protein
MELRSAAMTNSWEHWGIVEANDWLRAHSDDSGDPKVRTACKEIVKNAGLRSARVAPIPGSGGTKESPFVSGEPPEE